MEIMRRKAGMPVEPDFVKKNEKISMGEFNPSKPFGNKGSAKKHKRGNRFLDFAKQKKHH